MTLPAAIRRQAKNADRLVKELNDRPADAAAIAAAAAPPPSDAPANLPNVGDAPPPGAEPVAPAATTVTADPAAPAAAAQPENFEHKYRVLQGKYNKEQAELLSALNAARQTLAEAARANELLQAQVRAAPAPAAPAASTAPAPTSHLVTKEERDNFGDDLIDVVGRRAKEVLSPEVEALKREIAQLSSQVAGNTQDTVETKREKVYMLLSNRVPNWETINKSPQFLAWLEGIDVFSGSSRRISLLNAFNTFNASRVVGIFEAYAKEDASGSTAEPLVDPATLIAPGAPRSGSGEAAPGSQRGRIWSEGEIRQFYDRAARKRVPDKEYQEVSAEIARALQEGRVRPDHVDIHMNQR